MRRIVQARPVVAPEPVLRAPTERHGREPTPTEEEPCAAVGCSKKPVGRTPCCPEHWARVPVAEQVAYLEAVAEAILAPDVQKARRLARSRVGIVLRGVRA